MISFLLTNPLLAVAVAVVGDWSDQPTGCESAIVVLLEAHRTCQTRSALFSS